jgi:putative (di)nucleoside polyphosphate hydrolase
VGRTRSPRSRTPLDELLADPLIRLVMRADRVDAAELERLLRGVSSSLATAGRNQSSGPPVPDAAVCPDEDPNYRSGVGIMFLNQSNGVFVGQRIRSADAAWQMPQGGIEPGEPPRAAAFRELLEEIGTDNVEVLAESRGWLRYDLPPELVGEVWGGRWRGQQHKWFAMRFRGSDSEIDIETDHPEFSAWRWVSADALPGLIVAFKRQVYLEVLREFRGLQTPREQQ